MAKDNDDLASFKISDIKRPEVRSFTRPPADTDKGVTPSVSAGFPAIEARLESSTIEGIAEELRPTYERLEGLAAQGDLKSKAAAKKAMAAYERAADLFEYLYDTKTALSNP